MFLIMAVAEKGLHALSLDDVGHGPTPSSAMGLAY